ncbi:succinate dehydrogenase cytochrome b558 subunit [Peptococcaceae bacterium CEB3]|nr:succinate dehydrogenase cytochrome b558 subunit [Peptococcaceae bacterium CEB3]
MIGTFFWRRLHSLSGIIPIGVFLAEHMFINSLALKGKSSFNQGVALLHSIPYLFAVELVVIFLPLLFHAFYGLWLVYLTKNNVLPYTYFRNWLFYLQRVTALITLLFVGWHVWVLRFSSGLTAGNAFSVVAHALHSPAVMVLYIIGLLATFGHFTNGLWSFLVTWGITVGERAQRVAAYVCIVVFLVFTVVGLNALGAFI